MCSVRREELSDMSSSVVGRGSMKRRLTRIAPWQAAKVCAVLYFVLGLIFAIPLTLLALFAEPQPGEEQVGLGLAIAFPFLYAVGALIFVPIACWLYNLVARIVGGLEVEVEAREV
jgi:hypothetical protein